MNICFIYILFHIYLKLFLKKKILFLNTVGTNIFGEINASKTTIKKSNKENAETSEPHVAILLKK